MTLRRKSNDTPNEEMISWNFGGIEGYQFAGTGPIRYQDFEDPNIPGRYFPRMYYTWVKPLLSGGRPIGLDKHYLSSGEELVLDDPIPMISNIEAGTNAQGVKWDYVTDLMKIYSPNGNPPSKLNAWLINQPDGFDVNYWYGIKSNPFLINTWSQGFPTLSFIPTKLTTTEYSHRNHNTFDNGYDRPNSIIDVDKYPIRSESFRPENSDWYRRGCYQDIEANLLIDGEIKKIKRRFIICCDIEHNFYAFPIQARNSKNSSNENTNDFTTYGSKWGSIPADHFKKIAYSWPSPVDSSTIGKETIEEKSVMQRPDWNFNHSGTSAVCIVFLYSQWNEGETQSERYLDSSEDWVPIYEKKPMLIEINFSISITGLELNDFDFLITNGRIYDPNTTGRSIVSADYAVRNFDDLSVKADDLIILEYEMRMTDFTVNFPTTSVLRRYQTENSAYYHRYINKSSILYSNDYYMDIFTNNNQVVHIWDGKSRASDIDSINGTNPDFDAGEGSYAYFTSEYFIEEGKRLQKPNIATIAIIKNAGSLVDGPILKRWLAHYSSHQIESCSNPIKYLENKFYMVDYQDECAKFRDTSLKMNDFFSEISTPIHGNFVVADSFYNTFALSQTNLKEENKYADYSYVASIQSLELSTLTYLISASLSIHGTQFNSVLSDNEKAKIESISGTINVLTAFGIEENRTFGGYPLIQSQLESMYDLNTLFPDVDNYKKFDLRATISVSPTSLDNSSSYVESWMNLEGQEPNISISYHYFTNYLGVIEKFYRREEMYLNTEATAKVDVQNVVINYGDEVHVENRLFGCLNVQYGIKFVGFGDDYGYSCGDPLFRLKLSSSNEHTQIFSPSIFSFFDGDYKVIRPGTVVFNYERRYTNYTLSNKENYQYLYSGETPTDDIETKIKGSYSYSDYPFGSIYFNRVYKLTLHSMNNINNKVRTHPNGSYAVFSFPILCPKDKISMDITNSSFTTNKGLAGSEKDQLILDEIKYVYEVYNKKFNIIERFSTKSTHIELFNKAFNKDYTKEDYEIKYNSIGDTYGYGGNTTSYYSGGMEVIKSWVNPSLQESINILYHGNIGQYLGCNLSNPLSYNLVVENPIRSLYDLRIIPEVRVSQMPTNLSYSLKLEYNIFYQPTPRLESLFLVSNPYIDRDENN